MSPADLSGAERAELDRLRRENRLLRVEKEMLLRIATEYAFDGQARAISDESAASPVIGP